MKSYILLCLFFAVAINGSDQVTVFSNKTAVIGKLSDAELQKLWQDLQAALESSKDKNFHEKARGFVNMILKEKFERIAKYDKQAQDVYSKMLLNILLAVAFDGTALMLSGESAQYAIYSSALRQLAYDMSGFLLQDNRPVNRIAKSVISSQVISPLLQLPTAGGGIFSPDLTTALSYGSLPADATLKKMGYTDTVVAKFTQARESSINFLSSLWQSIPSPFSK